MRASTFPSGMFARRSASDVGEIRRDSAGVPALLKSRARALHRAGSNVPTSWTTRPDRRVTRAAAAMCDTGNPGLPRPNRIARIHGPS